MKPTNLKPLEFANRRKQRPNNAGQAHDASDGARSLFGWVQRTQSLPAVLRYGASKTSGVTLTSLTKPYNPSSPLTPYGISNIPYLNRAGRRAAIFHEHRQNPSGPIGASR